MDVLDFSIDSVAVAPAAAAAARPKAAKGKRQQQDGAAAAALRKAGEVRSQARRFRGAPAKKCVWPFLQSYASARALTSRTTGGKEEG